MFLAAARVRLWLPAMALAAAFAYPAAKAADAPAKAGEDVEFVVRIKPRYGGDGKPVPVNAESLKRTMAVIAARLQSRLPEKATLSPSIPDRIIVSVPSVTQKRTAEIRTLIETGGVLQLREVSRRNGERDDKGTSLAQRVIDGDEIVPGYKAYIYQHKDWEDKDVKEAILVSKRVALGGAEIAQAYPSPQRNDAVFVTLTAKGTDRMIALTTPMEPGIDRIAILLDDRILSAPVVSSVPLGKDFIIDGLRQAGEVQDIATAMMHPLEEAVEVVETRTASHSHKK